MTARRTASKNAPLPRTAYHHGNLREALVDAAVQLIEEQGVEQLSVREAAKRAGVSPAAPFRHFATRTALLTAVAEQATERLGGRVKAALARAAGRPPLERRAAIGRAYLGWAVAHPTPFRVISDRLQIDNEASDSMRQANQAIRDQMQGLLTEALGDGLSAAEVAQARLAARALVYGLARMAADGHFPEWSPPGLSTAQATSRTLDFFIALLGSVGRGAEAASAPARKAGGRGAKPGKA